MLNASGTGRSKGRVTFPSTEGSGHSLSKKLPGAQYLCTAVSDKKYLRERNLTTFLTCLQRF